MENLFQTPSDIHRYGQKINRFSQASKNLARNMTRFGFSVDDIKRVVGRGRYNTLEAQGYIIFGPQETAAARHHMEGLFGAFYYVHKPELQMSQQAPTLLGRAGCKLVAVVNGKEMSVPLDEVNFDFIARIGPISSSSAVGRITIRNDVIFYGERGVSTVLKAGTPIIKGRNWEADQGKPLFYIVDGQKHPLEEKAAVMMLWGHIGSMGFKKYGASSQQFYTIALDGTDDDFTAESHMVGWLESVKINNGIDLMPCFNEFVLDASRRLASNPVLMQAFATAYAVSDEAKQAWKKIANNPAIARNTKHQNTLLHYLINPLQDLAELDREIAPVVVELGLLLPEIEQTQDNQKFVRTVRSLLRDIATIIDLGTPKRLDVFVRDEVSRYIDQTRDPFAPEWFFVGGNNLKEAKLWGSYGEKFLACMRREDESATRLQEIAEQALLEKACGSINREFSKMIAYLRQEISDIDRRKEGWRDIEATLENGHKAVLSMVRELRTTPGQNIPDLSEKVEAIRAAYTLLNQKYGEPLGPEDKKNAALVGSMEIPAVQGRSQIHDSFKRSQIKATKNKARADRDLVKDKPRYWNERRAHTFARFLDMMNIVQCDCNRWFALYRDCSALKGKALAVGQKPIAASRLMVLAS